jgi:hypothetical protein
MPPRRFRNATLSVSQLALNAAKKRLFFGKSPLFRPESA